VRILAKLDTGADNCIFQRAYGEELGLDIESGDPRTFYTATGNFFEAFGHYVVIESFKWSFTSMVYFAKEGDVSRNVLGRNGWLRNFRLALIDYDSVFHVSAYDE
jgi:hypothetical protein